VNRVTRRLTVSVVLAASVGMAAVATGAREQAPSGATLVLPAARHDAPVRSWQ
jgi:fructose-specific phosphotransferase system IIC component